jgi:hypothetical protein
MAEETALEAVDGSEEDMPDEEREGKKLKGKAYAKELRALQAKLCRLQDWVKATGQRIIIVFEGRDAAARAGRSRPSPSESARACSGSRAARALGPREDADVHAALLRPLPGRGRDRDLRPELVQPRGRRIRARLLHQGAEPPVPRDLPGFEKQIVESGILLRKYWLEVSPGQQKKRFQARIEDPLRQWKLSATDLESRRRWYDYSRARDRMLDATDTKWAPWYVVKSDDKKRARLNLIAHLLDHIPYERVKREKVQMVGRSKKHAYNDEAPMKHRRWIPDAYEA